jgi:hypothetical protein
MMATAVSLSERIAVHEAGHAVVALTCAIPIISVSIDAVTPHFHRGGYRTAPDIGLESVPTMCLSGPVADGGVCACRSSCSSSIASSFPIQ